METSYSGAREPYFGEIKQRDDRYILFRVNAIASEIVVPELVPIVQRLTNEMLAMDAKFQAGNRD